MKKKTHWLSLVLSAALALSPAMSTTALAATAEPGEQEVINASTTWKYVDDNAPAASGWTEASFDDSAWKSGTGSFGAKNGEAKDLGNGCIPNTLLNQYYTDTAGNQQDIPVFYFRTSINVSSADAIDELTGSLLYDDCAIVYINGVKAAAFDETGADAAGYEGSGSGAPKTGTIDITGDDLTALNLKDGANTVAVELHQQRPSSSDIYFDFSSLKAVIAGEQSRISIAPGSDQSKLNFSWYSTKSDAGKIVYAKTSELVNGSLPSDAKTAGDAAANTASKEGYYYFHQTISDLEPGTEYTYQLVNGTQVSSLHTFKTAASGDFSFLLVGDPQVGAGDGNTATTDTSKWNEALSKFTQANKDAAFLLSAGDQVNVSNNEDQYDGYLNNDIMPTLINPTVIGNHDSGSGNYDEHFYTANESDQYGKTAAGSDGWFVYNNTLFLQLNDNNMTTAEHKAFMQEAIAANPGVNWKIVVMHHSLYSVANHAFDGDILQRRSELVPVFDDLGIDVVLQGHDHVYVRSYIMKGDTPLTDKSAYDDDQYSSITDPDGILYVTANSGSGSKYYNIKSDEFSYAAVKNQEYVPTYSNVSVKENSFTITTYRTNDNSVIDTFTINHDPESDIESHISIAPGSDESKLNFSWYATKNLTGKVVYAKTSEVKNGVLPANAKTSEDTEGAVANNNGYYYFHQTISGLEPGTSYTYQLMNGTHKSALHTFKTAAAGDFSFLLVGDPQIGAGDGNTATTDVEGWEATLKDLYENYSDSAFLLSAGDQVNVADDENQYDGYLENDYLPNMINATVVGNHDSKSDSYDQHFYSANESNKYGATAAGSDAWFTYNGTLIMQLNDNNMSTAQHKAFLKEAIAANPNAKWKVVTMHHSLYSVANHAFDSDILQRRSELVPVFEELGIDVVLQGHDHVYVRSYIMKGDNPVTDKSAYDDDNYSSITNPNGILYITANSGSGSKYYKIQNENFSYAAVKNQENTPTFSKITVTDNTFTVTTYRVKDNSKIDSFTIKRDTETSIPMYRMYNPNSGEHFYTANVQEKNNLTALGWHYEGIGWYAPKKSSSPVYRLYNPNAGDHHYTLQKAERDNLIKAGWRYEGIGWYSDDEKTVPLYRQYNPNAVSGAHNFTTSLAEQEILIKAGWHAEGIGWYGVES
ncbi:MAG: metallophosphoesterase [Bilifractor sp.]|jgi:predicted phosphodiesterase